MSSTPLDTLRPKFEARLGAAAAAAVHGDTLLSTIEEKQPPHPPAATDVDVVSATASPAAQGSSHGGDVKIETSTAGAKASSLPAPLEREASRPVETTTDPAEKATPSEVDPPSAQTLTSTAKPLDDASITLTTTPSKLSTSLSSSSLSALRTSLLNSYTLPSSLTSTIHNDLTQRVTLDHKRLAYKDTRLQVDQLAKHLERLGRYQQVLDDLVNGPLSKDGEVGRKVWQLVSKAVEDEVQKKRNVGTSTAVGQGHDKEAVRVEESEDEMDLD